MQSTTTTKAYTQKLGAFNSAIKIDMKYRKRHHKPRSARETEWFSECYTNQWNPGKSLLFI